MRPSQTARTAVLVLLAALAVVVGVSRVPGVLPLEPAAAAAKDFTLGAQPTSASIARGTSTTYRVTATAVSGFTGTVDLTLKGLPTGASAAFSPASVKLTGAATSAPSDLVVTTAATTPTGSATLTVTGTSGSTKHTLDLTLVVNPPAPALGVAASPATISVAPGSTATYGLTVSRTNGFAGAVTLTVAGLPPGATGALSPTSLPAGATSATLQVSVAASAADSTSALTVTASGSGVPSATASVELVVDSKLSAKPFSLGGDLTGTLFPGGAGRPLDLTITNPNNQPLRVTNLGVTVSSTSRATCAPSNFTVRQYEGSYPLTVPAGAVARSLTSLGVPASALPTVQLLDSPSTNQDACKAVTVRLAYTGSATNQ